jgi:ABC-type dipeptide/oligopeptide/nickel transport system permease subunit
MANKFKSNSLWQMAWIRLKRNRLAMISLGLILFATLIAILGSLIRPDKTPMCNDMLVQIGGKKPGFTVQVLNVRKNQIIQQPGFLGRLFFGGVENEYVVIPISSYKFVDDEIEVIEFKGSKKRHNVVSKKYKLADVAYPLSLTSDVNRKANILSFYTITGQMVVTSIEDLQQYVIENNLETRKYWLGTDRHGRDMLSRLMAGTLVSLAVGFISVFISMFIGTAFGAIGGYFRGRIDDFIIWLINVVWSIPTLLLVIAITLALGKGFWQVFVAVGLTMWVEVARVVRGQFLSLREKEFVEAGKALGFSNFRIIFKHVLPNVIGPIIVLSAADFASAIIMEAGLSFLGIGAQSPMASWGSMIRDNNDFIYTKSSILAILPGLAIMIMVLAFIILGNGLRDALDVKSKPQS